MTNMEENTGPKLLPKKQSTERTSKDKLKLVFRCYRHISTSSLLFISMLSNKKCFILTSWGISCLCTVLRITIDVLNQDSLQRRKAWDRIVIYQSSKVTSVLFSLAFPFLRKTLTLSFHHPNTFFLLMTISRIQNLCFASIKHIFPLLDNCKMPPEVST